MDNKLGRPRGRATALPPLPLTEASCTECRAWVWALDTGRRYWPIKFDLEVRHGVQWYTVHRCGRSTHPPRHDWPR